jgi:N-acetylglutamate synthase/N-acetylornithine aminotransferase
VAAVGRSGAHFDQSQVDCYLVPGECLTHPLPPVETLCGLQLVRRGQPYQLDEDVATTIVKGKEVTVVVDLNQAQQCHLTKWTCDLSKEYVAINADYRS